MLLTTPKRQSNIELLRIVIMLMIISGHIILATKSINNLFSIDYYVLNFMQVMFRAQVNVFVLISGYFGIKLKFFKLAQMDLRTVIYTYILFAVAVLLGLHTINIKKDILFMFPVLTKQYWFVTEYFVLCLLSPFLNWFLTKQTKRNLQVLLIIGFIVFYGIATGAYLVNSAQIVDDAGRGIVNFVFLYFLGYYIRNHFKDSISSSGKYFALFFISSVLCYIVNVGMTMINGFYFNSMISNNTVFVLLSSVFLFLAFNNLYIGYHPFINIVASKTLAVYIIHTFPLLSDYIYYNIMQVQKLSGPLLYVLCLVAPFIIYLFCFIIDYFMDYILKPLDVFLRRALSEIKICLD